MALYRIENARSGVVLGEYDGDTAEEALNAMARDAGYADYAKSCEVVPVADGEILVTLVA